MIAIRKTRMLGESSIPFIKVILFKTERDTNKGKKMGMRGQVIS